MTRRLPALAFALAFASSVGAAEAGHAHFSGGVHFSGGAHWGGGFSGGVHVSGGAGYSSYHWSRPAYGGYGGAHWGVRGSIYVGGYYPYYYRPYYYSYYPEYVPTYYSSYYPVTAEASYGPSMVAPVRPDLPKLGIGLFGGAVNTTDANGNQQHDSSDVGILGRLRLGNGGLMVEGELGKSSYDVGNASNVRVDRRIGGSLLYEIGAYNALAPYVLAGIGVQQADVGGDYSTTQDFAEIGVGLRWAITPHFHLTADIRAGSRSSVANDQTMPAGTAVRSVTPPSSDSGQTEDYTRGRLAAILYF